MKLLRLAREKWDVLAVCDEDWTCQVVEFLLGLEGKSRSGEKMLHLLRQRVASAGPPRNIEISKELEDGIFEFRRGQVRVLWFYDAGRVVVCTHGIWKQEQKLPKREIRKAKDIRTRYWRAKSVGVFDLTNA